MILHAPSNVWEMSKEENFYRAKSLYTHRIIGWYDDWSLVSRS